MYRMHVHGHTCTTFLNLIGVTRKWSRWTAGIENALLSHQNVSCTALWMPVLVNPPLGLQIETKGTALISRSPMVAPKILKNTKDPLQSQPVFLPCHMVMFCYAPLASYRRARYPLPSVDDTLSRPFSV